ncbi:MAG: sigma-70 family RNA polymerase sigma factor [Candidatus Rifleibacteriota bacterium]
MGTISSAQESVLVDRQIELVNRCRRGDKKAFAELVAEFEKGVYRLCYRFFNDENDAMDATQEVFIKIYRALPGFEGRSSLKTWIYRIASNTCITIAEKRRREKDGLLQTIINWWSDRNVETPEEEFIDNETRQLNQKMVAEKLEKLPETYRMPVILKDIEGLSLEKISEILEVPVGTVKSRINRGRRMLQESLQLYYQRSSE